MGDMLKDGLAFLTSQLRANASQTVTYTRGTESIEVQATLGNKLLKINDQFGGVRLEWTDLDFLIPAADVAPILVNPKNPDDGDLIFVSQPDQGQVQVYIVEHIESESPWRWADPHQSMYRIHGKHVRTDAIPY